MTYEGYKRARDKSWEILIKYRQHSLPVPVWTILDREGILVRSFNYFKKNEIFSGYEIPPKKVAFCFRIQRYFFIFYDESQTVDKIRYALAHEFGHIALGHANDGVEENYEANVFASRLLCPAVLLRKYKTDSPKAIAKICLAPLECANSRYKRLMRLMERDKWYQSPLEWQI